VDKKTLKQKAYHELKEYLVITLYLWLIFGLFVIYKSVILRENDIHLTEKGLALINALALGKIMLIAKAFNLGRRFDDAPLIYPTLFKSGIFAIILAIFKVLEELIVGYFRGETLSRSLDSLAGGTMSGILTLTVIMFVVLIPFVAVGELGRVLGEGKLRETFLRPRPEAQSMAA
jgi:hypothetical protein